MSDAPGARDGEAADADEALLAELFDDLLQQVLDGTTPALEDLVPGRPDLLPRVRAVWDLACSVAGRREAGHPVLGGYEILRELGRGGMGTVYLARHQALQREVAIKVLPQSLALSPRARRRFLDEARALARLRHDHVVHIHRIVDHTEMLAFEMEYVEGPSLQQLLVELKKHGPRPLPDQLAAVLGAHAGPATVRSTVEYFVRLGIAIARALAEVHRHGIVHRDVKPSNILLRRNGTPVLADFGLARDSDVGMTQTVAFAGTPIYAAPERLRDGDLGLDGRADVYSLGVTLYEAITLSPPYQGRSTQEVLRRIENGDIVPLRRRTPHVSRDLQTVLHKAMEADPRHRYATADEFADDLDRLLALQPVRARPKGPVRRLWLAGRRQRKPLLGAAAGALLVTLLLWPWFATVQAAADAHKHAQVHTHRAQELLLEPGGLGFGAPRGFAASTVGRLQTAQAAQVEALRAVLAEYDAARLLLPDDRQLRQERAVVATALWLRTASPASFAEVEAARRSAEFAAATDGLPAVTRQAAEQLVAGGIDLARVDGDPAAAADDERFAFGLLAALCGETAACERAWTGLDAGGFSHPLLDAGLGLLAAADGYPERAYPRLFHATREFPQSRALAFELARAALQSGDAQLARDWLQQPATADGDPTQRRQLLAADVAAASGDRDEAERGYRAILRQRPADTEARRRLALLAMLRGDLHTAREHLLLIARRWPELATVQLDLARLALQAKDRAAYLAAARFALTRLLDGEASRGRKATLFEILRLGGLVPALAEVLAGDEPAEIDWRRVELPTPPWRDAADLRRAADTLQLLATYDRAVARAARLDGRPIAAVARGVYAVAAHHGIATRPWPLLAPAALLAAAPWVLRPELQYYASMLLMPFQRSLGTPLQTVAISGLSPTIDTAGRQLMIGALTTLGPCDGTEDLLLGIAPVRETALTGRVEVRDAGTGELRATVADGDVSSIFGYSVCDLGDVDGDGIADFAVGAPLRDNSRTSDGSVLVYSGRDHTLLRRIQGRGVGFGVALANLGDLDGDGRAELCIGTSPELRNTAAQGAATVVSPATGQVRYEVRSDRAGVWFGAAVAAVGDLDGDHFCDFAVGGNHGDAPGLVRVYSGRDGALLHELEEDPDAFDFGRVVCGIADVDGDDVDDLAVSAPGFGAKRQVPGRVTLFSGRRGRRLVVLAGDDAGDLFGFGLCALPDWIGDGRPALAIAAGRGGVTGSGYARVFGLRPLRPLQTFFAPAGVAVFSRSMTPCSDREGRTRPRLALAMLRPDGERVVAFRYTLDEK